MLKLFFAACALLLAGASFAQKTPPALPAQSFQAVPVKKSAATAPDAAAADEPTFFKLFNLEAGLALCPSGDGNIYAAGAYEGDLALLKLNPAGNILDQWIFDIAVGGPGHVNEILVDSDGMIAGCGVLSDAGYGQGFVFRFDPVDGTFFWVEILPGELRTVHGLLEKSPGGDFILYSDQAGASNSPELMQIDRQTGAVVPAFACHYHFNGSDEFAAMIAHQGALYAVGQSGAGTGPGKRRHALARIDGISGAAQWAHLTPVALGGTAALYGLDLLIDNDQIVSVFSGNPGGTGLTPSYVFLQKTALDGTTAWVKRYDLTEWANEFVEEVVSVPDGYVMIGHQVQSGDQLFLMKVDKDGQFLWAKKAGYASGLNFNALSEQQGQLLAVGDYLYFIASTLPGSGDPAGRMVLVKVNSEGETGSSDCTFLAPTPVTETTVPNPVTTPVQLQETAFTPFLMPAAVAFKPSAAALAGRPCAADTPADCAVQADAEFVIDGVQFNDDGIRLFYTLCNHGDLPLPKTIQVSFYGTDPTAQPAGLLGTLHLQHGAGVNGCHSGSVVADFLTTGQTVFAVVNDGGQLSAPFQLADLAANGSVEECTYANNLHSLDLSVPTDTCQGPTFLKVLGSPDETERGLRICPSNHGTAYVAGTRRDSAFLLEMDAAGEVLWMRVFDAGPGQFDNISGIITDSEGMIAGCGMLEWPDPGTGFIFRFDPATQSFQWFRHLDGPHSVVFQLLEMPTDGNFLLSSNPHKIGGDDDAELLVLDRLSGAVVPSPLNKQYDLSGSGSDQFNLRWHEDGFIYGAGRFTDGNTFGDMRHGLIKINPATGQPVWTYLSHVQFGEARLYGRDLVVENDHVISLYSGNDQGANAAPSHIFLQKTTLDGSLEWRKRLDVAGFDNEYGDDLVSLPDGFLIYGRAQAAPSDLLLIKTDKNGLLQWAKKLDYALNDNFTYGGTHTGQIFATDHHLYFTAYAEQNGNSDVLIAKTSLDGAIGGDCAQLQPLDVTVSEEGQATWLVTMTVVPSPTQAFVQPVAAAAGSLPEQTLCQEDCLQACDTLPDLVLTLDSVVCGSGASIIHLTLCNAGAGPSPSPVTLGFYAGNPLTGPAALLELFSLPVTLAPGGCVFGNLPVPSGSGLTLYALAGVDSTAVAPIPLDSFPFAGPVECDYANNFDSLIFDYPAAPALDLGPDVVVCEDEPYTFQATPGFFAYLWQDGSTGASLTVALPGVYSVEATDVCGFVQRDSVVFTWSQVADIQQPDYLICPGDSVAIALTGFDTYAWSPAAGLSCTTCAAVTIQPAVSTVYTLLATNALGCVLTDTFLVEIAPLPTRTEVLDFCEGDAITINGITYTQSVTALDTLAATAGCDTVVTYQITFAPLPTRSEALDFCQGDAVTINGITYTQSGTAVDTLPAVAGCDTVVTYQLTFAPLPTQTDTLSFFFGQSVTINGITYTQPATALDTLPALSGCDTVVTYVLLFTLPPSQLHFSCPGGMVVDPMPGMAGAMVTFAVPTVTSTCPFGQLQVSQVSGPASGSMFPVGDTEVCFAAQDTCGSFDTCCFTVTVNEEEPCDVKTVGCVTFELLSIALDAEGDRHYRVRFTNGCTGRPLTYLAIQVPDGTIAVGPADASTYVAPSGRGYSVRNPNSNPFHSIRFKAQGPGIANGQSDIFEYTIVEQSQPTFIHVFARLNPEPSYEAHLNTFNCPVLMLHQDRVAREGAFQATPAEENEPGSGAGDYLVENTAARRAHFRIHPNPTQGTLNVELGNLAGHPATIRLLTVQGQILQVWQSKGGSVAVQLMLPEHLPNGLYLLEMEAAGAERRVERFVLQRS